MSRTVALLTDFGTTDTYVGVMKGVMLSICPDLQLVDLTHAVQPQNIRQAAFLLLNSYRYFPKGTVFLVVVDPGVGSDRKPIAVQAGGYTFVAPDNGVLSYVLGRYPSRQAVQLENPDYRLWGISNTFHGRDIFAPAAAHLAAGVVLEQLGSFVSDLVVLSTPLLAIEDNRIIGEMLYADHFGNVITSIEVLHWLKPTLMAFRNRFGAQTEIDVSTENSMVFIGEHTMTGVYRTYGDVSPGKALALIGSSNHLELSVSGGNFAAQFGVQIGDPVELQIG